MLRIIAIVNFVRVAATFLADTLQAESTAQLGDTDYRIPRQPGCFCLRSSLHNHLCRDDFVIRARILDDSQNRGPRHALRGYQIQVKEIFHLPPYDKLKVGERVALYTPASDDFCGTSFVRRGMYLLSGRIVNNILVVTSCDYSRKWATVTQTIRKNLQQLPNKRHCNCKIFGCSGEMCGNEDSANAFNVFETTKCAHKRDTLQERCYEDFGQCRMNNQGTCGWKNQRKPKVCMNVSRRRLRLIPDPSSAET